MILIGVFFVFGLILTLVFSFSISSYLVNYKFNITSNSAKFISLAILTLLISITILIVELFVIWP